VGVRVLDPRESKCVEASAGSTARCGVNVLLVEDFSPLRNVIRRDLERRGYTVVAASNGVEALRRVASQHHVVHLLLTDVRMPGIDGPQLARRLIKLHPGIGVLYMSGNSEEAFDDPAMAKAAFIRKPFEISALMEKIREESERLRCSGRH
jgi:two-component system, cell cycle sensor histidine kinase and response regulator CckA